MQSPENIGQNEISKLQERTRDNRQGSAKDHSQDKHGWLRVTQGRQDKPTAGIIEGNSNVFRERVTFYSTTPDVKYEMSIIRS